MEKKTLGRFLAALRKSAGLTQQEVADRLNVSNKAVSRWERDECAPDLTLIPVIAEMFGVTADELLRGERNRSGEPPKIRGENQLRLLAKRAVSRFIMTILIALALTLLGLVCLFGIAYGFYRPVIGIAVLLLFVIVSVLLSVAAVLRLKESTANGLPEDLSPVLAGEWERPLARYSYAALFTNLAAVLLAVPFALFSDSIFVDSVVSLDGYLSCLPFIFLALAVLFRVSYAPYCARLLGKKSGKPGPNKAVRRLNGIQGGLAAAALLALEATIWNGVPGGLAMPEFTNVVLAALFFVFLALMLAAIPVYAVRHRASRRWILFSGVRNAVLAADVLFILGTRSISWEEGGSVSVYLNFPAVSIGLLAAAAVLLLSYWFSPARREDCPQCPKECNTKCASGKEATVNWFK